MEDEKRLEKLMNRVNKLDDNLLVNVKISFLLEAMNEIINTISLDDKFFDIIVARYKKIKFMKELNREYISIKASELKYLLEMTKDMDINRNMIVITNRGRNR